jgi:hypothetical protein
MSHKIFKYEFAISDNVEIPMPRGAELLTVQVQRGIPCLWARVDTTEPRTSRRFRIFGTGHEMPSYDAWNGQYVGTFQMEGGALVWHLYEDRND